MTSKPSAWMTEENLAILARMWEHGKTADDIACEISKDGYRVTRNAIIGKARRLNLCHNIININNGIANERKKPIRRIRKGVFAPNVRNLPIEQRKAAFKRVFFERKKVHRNGGTFVKKDPDKSNQILLIDTAEHHCRAIVGYQDNDKGKAICCGEDTVECMRYGRVVKSPWCGYHHDKYTMEPRK